jgi:hypothetical protein
LRKIFKIRLANHGGLFFIASKGGECMARGRSFTGTITGAKELERRLGKKAAVRLKQELDESTELYARKIASEAAETAPVDTGLLANSIASSPRQERVMSWLIGSPLPYAVVQEYEHKSQKAFFRKSIWGNRTAFRDDIKQRIRSGLK